jgi:hypothetical protein
LKPSYDGFLFKEFVMQKRCSTQWIGRVLGHLVLISVVTLLSAVANAEQFKSIKNIDVHYSAFNSAFLSAEMARQYHLQRTGHEGLINISVLDTSQLGNPAIPSVVKGKVTNLIGQYHQLTFTEVKEGDAIYYLSQFPIEGEDLLSFDISIDAELKGRGDLKFQQQFYVEE